MIHVTAIDQIYYIPTVKWDTGYEICNNEAAREKKKYRVKLKNKAIKKQYDKEIEIGKRF